MNAIEILYSLDENGMELFFISLYSLLKNKHNESHYAITVAYKNLTVESMQKINNLVTRFRQTTMRFVNCYQWDTKYDLSNISDKSHPVLKLSWPSPMYYYFFAPLFYDRNIDQVIYLDIDTIIQKDLTELYEWKVSKTFAGAKCTVIIPYINHQNIVRKMLGEQAFENLGVKFTNFISDDQSRYDNYANSGVLLINLKVLTTINLDALFKIAHEKKLNDQDLLSYYFVDDLENFSSKYNFCVHFFIDEIVTKQLQLNDMSMNDLNNYLNYAFVVHITIRPKPIFFFNQNNLPLIKKCGGITKFVDVISKPNQYLNQYQITLNDEEQKKITDLNNIWANRLYNDTQTTRLYERVYYQWGLLWEEITRVFN